MTISPLPFLGSVCVAVNVSPIVYALYCGKWRDYAPPCFPDPVPVQVFIDLPYGELAEDMAWLEDNYLWVKRQILEWMIAPKDLN